MQNVALLALTAWLVIYGLVLARRVIVAYRRAVRIFDDTHADDIGAYIEWLSTFTYWNLGAMFKAGQFNYKLSETGKQGDLMGGGITAGYQLRLNKVLALDFNLGLGYLNADFEKYEVIDDVRVRRGNETKDWCGPINAGVTLVWKLF